MLTVANRPRAVSLRSDLVHLFLQEIRAENFRRELKNAFEKSSRQVGPDSAFCTVDGLDYGDDFFDRSSEVKIVWVFG